MDFNELRRSTIEPELTLLDMIDEFSLYCFYTEIDNLQLNRTYPAPFRNDLVPSFVVFRSTKSTKVQYLWKDHGKGEVGDIFLLIKKMCNLENRQEVLAKVSQDFGLGFDLPPVNGGKIVLYNPPVENSIKIRVATCPFSSKGMGFWEQFGIGLDLLDLYQVTQIKWYWSYEGQPTPYWVPDPTFAYRVGQYYQIYSPFAPKTEKFRNDLPENYFFGYLQLPSKGQKLIIDKSSKDVIFCRSLDYDAISGKSETTMIPHNKMLELIERFEEIYLMLDPDPAGLKMTEKYLALYPSLMPRFMSIAKDKTDTCKVVGREGVRTILKDILKAA